MKPRFSILTLLGVTAYIAVNLFAMTSPVRWRAEACFYVWLATLAGMAVGASQPVNTRVAFFRGFLYFAAIYTMGAFSFEGALPHAPIAELIGLQSSQARPVRTRLGIDQACFPKLRICIWIARRFTCFLDLPPSGEEGSEAVNAHHYYRDFLEAIIRRCEWLPDPSGELSRIFLDTVHQM